MSDRNEIRRKGELLASDSVLAMMRLGLKPTEIVAILTDKASRLAWDAARGIRKAPRPAQRLDPVTLDIVTDRTEVSEARVDKPLVVEDRDSGRAHLTLVWRTESTYSHLDQLGPNGPDILKARRSYAVAVCGHEVAIIEGGEQILRPDQTTKLPMCELCEVEAGETP